MEFKFECVTLKEEIPFSTCSRHQWVHKRTTLQLHIECGADGRETEFWTRTALWYQWALFPKSLEYINDFNSYNNGDGVQQCTVSLSNASAFCAGESNWIFLFFCSGILKYWNGFDGFDIQCGSQDVGVSTLKRPCLSLWPNEVVNFKTKALASKHWFSEPDVLVFLHILS